MILGKKIYVILCRSKRLKTKDALKLLQINKIIFSYVDLFQYKREDIYQSIDIPCTIFCLDVPEVSIA